MVWNPDLAASEEATAKLRTQATLLNPHSHLVGGRIFGREGARKEALQIHWHIQHTPQGKRIPKKSLADSKMQNIWLIGNPIWTNSSKVKEKKKKKSVGTLSFSQHPWNVKFLFGKHSFLPVPLHSFKIIAHFIERSEKSKTCKARKRTGSKKFEAP